MEVVELVVAVAGVVVGAASVYVGYLAVRQRVRRRRWTDPPARPVSGSEPARDRGSEPAHDVFVSYCPPDVEWVREFVDRLAGHGVTVGYDELVLAPGDVIVHSLESAIDNAQSGLLVFSPYTADNGWARQEYWTLMQRSIESGRRFIPVLIGDVDPATALPSFARTRFVADLREVDSDTYDRVVEQIAHAVENHGEASSGS